MIVLDLIYYLSYRAYEKGNSKASGAFLISSFWISLFQFILLFIILTPIEVYSGLILFPKLENFYFFALYIIILVGLNNLYLNFKDRKKFILSRFNFSKNEEIIYFVLLVITFFASIWIAISLVDLKH